MVTSKNTGRPAAVQIPPPAYDFWSTGKLAQMTAIARRLVAEAQARFEATLAVERRRCKRTYQSEEAELHVRRAEDRLALMRAELERRALETVGERRVGPRRGPEHRSGLWDREPAPAASFAAVAQ